MNSSLRYNFASLNKKYIFSKLIHRTDKLVDITALFGCGNIDLVCLGTLSRTYIPPCGMIKIIVKMDTRKIVVQQLLDCLFYSGLTGSKSRIHQGDRRYIPCWPFWWS